MSAKYQQLANILRSELSSVSEQGGKLQTEAELSARYHMSRQTVRHALQLLTDEGLIERRQGSGSYVKMGALRSESMQIAVITSFLDDYIFPKVLHDAQMSFSRSGYSTLVFATENRVGTEREILTRLLSLGVSGILVEATKSALPTPNADLYIRLRERGIPIVFLHGIYSNLSGFPCVLDDNVGGGYLLTRYLLDQGHRRIASIFKSDDLQGPGRYQGMTDALRDAEQPIPDNSIVWFDTEDRRQFLSDRQPGAIGELIGRRMDEATAVICYNDEVAYHLIRHLLSTGKRVPEDMAVVSFDDSYLSQMGPVPITSLGQRSGRIGQEAAKILLDMLAGKPGHSLMMQWELVRRQSG